MYYYDTVVWLLLWEQKAHCHLQFYINSSMPKNKV